jgi:hypothetical protein
MQKKKLILIIFLDSHFAYSPTLQNLSEILSTKYEIFFFGRSKINESKINSFYYDPNIKFPKLYFFAKIFDSILYRLIKKRIIIAFLDYHFFSKKIFKIKNKKNYDFYKILGVDTLATLIGIKIFGSCHFISLEIYKSQLINLYLSYKINCINSLMIQSIKRKKTLLKKYNGPTFFIENSPFYKKIYKRKFIKNSIIFFGSFLPVMGSEIVKAFAKDYPEFKITIRGPVKLDFDTYKLPINCFVDNKYICSAAIQKYLNVFELSFCFYDTNSFKEDYKDTFSNGVSGKMYNYFNALVPIIGNSSDGLKAIKQYSAGILVNKPNSDSIYNAICKIRENYNFYVRGCRLAAIDLNFQKKAKKYISFLSK